MKKKNQSVAIKFFNQKEFIKAIIKKDNRGLAVFWGLLGCYIFPLVSSVSRMISDGKVLQEISNLLTKELVGSALYFSLEVVLVYGICKLITKQKSFHKVLITSGFSGIYAVIASFFVSVMMVSTMIMKDQTQPSLILMMVFFISAILLINLFFYSFKYQVLALREIYKFGVVKAFFITLFVYIPLIFIYDFLI